MKDDQVLLIMQYDIDLKILELNFLEFLTNYLEGRGTVSAVFQVNDRIRLRNPDSLSQSLLVATTTLHELKEKIDAKEEVVDKDIIRTTITDVVLDLLDK